MSHFLYLIPFFIIALPASAQNNLTCPSYDCGNVTIRYPFWRIGSESATQYCGYEGFGINCSVNGDQSISNITLGNESYYVRGIDYSLRNIYLTDYDFSPVARDLNNCPRVRHNVNLGTLPLNFWYSRNLSFHFDCTDCPSFATRIPCLDNNGRRSCVVMMNNITEEPQNWDDYSCSENVVTKVFSEYTDMNVNLSKGYGRMLERGFGLRWESMDTDDCKKCEESGGQCGRHNTTGFMCFCYDGEIKKGDCKGSQRNLRLKLGIGIGSTLMAFVIVSIVYCIWKLPSSNCVASLKHKTEENISIETFVIHYGSSSTKRYKYNDIKKITNSFQIKLGQGGFGQVYKGNLSDGRLVAVKLLNSSKANGQDFINEVASIGRTSHVNIVTLLGFCFDNKKRALIYEYMPNGSLEKFIHGHIPMKTTSEHIGVKKLHEIALGIAYGLDYLHRGCNTRILHLDIKPHNILLDEDFCPKIADFGLAKLYSRKDSIVSMLEARGTIGYIAPEVYNKNFGGVSHKSDVYSYGMLLLDMVGGRKNVDADIGSRTSEVYFPNWIYNRLQKDDFLLDGVTTTEETDYARKMTIVSLWCIQPSPNQRPTINEVIEMLEGSMETLEVPPKPFFSSPPRSPATVYSTSESIQDTT